MRPAGRYKRMLRVKQMKVPADKDSIIEFSMDLSGKKGGTAVYSSLVTL